MFRGAVSCLVASQPSRLHGVQTSLMTGTALFALSREKVVQMSASEGQVVTLGNGYFWSKRIGCKI